MKNILFIISLTLLTVGCGHQNRNKQNSSDQVYVAKSDFDGVPQIIKINELDSLIKSRSIKSLNEFYTKDSFKNIAYEVLKKELVRKKIDTVDLLIKWAKRLNDSIIEFRISHIDDIVYSYNWDKMIRKVVPITGNISGYDGWYKVNINKKILRISYAQ